MSWETKSTKGEDESKKRKKGGKQKNKCRRVKKKKIFKEKIQKKKTTISLSVYLIKLSTAQPHTVTSMHETNPWVQGHPRAQDPVFQRVPDVSAFFLKTSPLWRSVPPNPSPFEHLHLEAATRRRVATQDPFQNFPPVWLLNDGFNTWDFPDDLSISPHYLGFHFAHLVHMTKLHITCPLIQIKRNTND